MGATTTRLTFEQFARLPDEPGRFELLDGELVRMLPAKYKHVKVAHRLQALLQDALRPNDKEKFGEAYLFMAYKLGSDTLLQPDVSVPHAAQPEADYYEGAPALAVEIISEWHMAEHVDAKLREYFGTGAREVWLVYLKTCHIWVYSDDHAIKHTSQLTSGLLPGVSIDLEALL